MALILHQIANFHVSKYQLSLSLSLSLQRITRFKLRVSVVSIVKSYSCVRVMRIAISKNLLKISTYTHTHTHTHIHTVSSCCRTTRERKKRKNSQRDDRKKRGPGQQNISRFIFAATGRERTFPGFVNSEKEQREHGEQICKTRQAEANFFDGGGKRSVSPRKRISQQILLQTSITRMFCKRE